MNKSTYHDLKIQNTTLKIGPYQVRSLSTASFGLDGGAMFGTVPKVLWERTNPSDEQNRILLDCRCLLLESNDQKILIDTGLGADFEFKYGPKLGPKFSKMYAVKDSKKSGIEKALESLSITPDQITHVILSHLHFDHTGGSTKEAGGQLVPTFKNATYYIQKQNLETALNPNLREKASYYTCNFKPLLDAGVLEVLNGACEVLPFIKAVLTHGHTQGQQNIWVEDEKTSLLYCADLIPTATHVKLPWVMGYDLDPLKLIEEKKERLIEAAQKNSFLFFEHDPYCAAAQVESIKNGSDFKLKEIFSLS